MAPTIASALAIAAVLIAHAAAQGIPGGGGRGRGGGGGGIGNDGDDDDDNEPACYVAHCFRCSVFSRFTCASCDGGYTLAHNGNSCLPCSQHCYKCDTSGPHSCDDGQCNGGYFQRHGIRGVNECEACSSGCYSCTSSEPGDCTACRMLYRQLPDGGGCELRSWIKPTIATLVAVAIATVCFHAARSRERHAVAGEERPRGHADADAANTAAHPLAAAARWPSGSWRGYYTHLDGQHGVCEFQLRFAADGSVRGEGSDDVGAYTIHGAVAPPGGDNGGGRGGGELSFVKRYVAGSASAGGRVHASNKGHSVTYRGRAARLDADGAPSLAGGVRGAWSIRHAQHGNYDGRFHLWPVMPREHWQAAAAAERPAAGARGEQGGTGSGGSGGAAGGGDEDVDVECCVCYDRRIDAALEPCGHVALCAQCAARLRPQRCPLCRADITRIVAVAAARS